MSSLSRSKGVYIDDKFSRESAAKQKPQRPVRPATSGGSESGTIYAERSVRACGRLFCLVWPFGRQGGLDTNEHRTTHVAPV